MKTYQEEIQNEIGSVNKNENKNQYQQYLLSKVVGRGTFGTVYLA
jgi:hypothetical protein